jgi:ankyrin repeat protein
VNYGEDGYDDGRSALMCAALNGHAALVRAFAEAGANVDWKDHDSQTPMSSACRRGHPAVVKALIEAGVDIHQRINGSFKTAVWIRSFLPERRCWRHYYNA